MGSSQSKRDSASKRMSGEILEEQRRKILEENGILIPPAFGVTGTPSQKGTGPSMSTQHRLLQYSYQPVSYVQYLQETDLSQILLHDHMHAGVWVMAQAADQTKIHVSVFPEDSSNILNNTAGQLFLQHQASPLMLQLRTGTTDPTEPYVSAGLALNKTCSLFASSTVSGQGWLGGHLDHTVRVPSLAAINNQTETTTTTKMYDGLDVMSRDLINAKVGAWAPVDWSHPIPNNANNKNNNKTLNAVHGYAAVNLLGATAAVQGHLDTTHKQPFSLATYFSVNLNDRDRPPLQLTLDRDNQRSSISLCQCLAFDRLQWNVMDDRAPKVRNTLAWTIRMESSPAGSGMKNLAEDSGEHHNNNAATTTQHRLSLGAAWQINRGLALKAVFRQDEGFTTAIIAKRWNQPRMACSVLHRWNPSMGSIQWLGLGLEVETGMLKRDPDSYYYNYHPGPVIRVTDCEDVPQTRAVLPPEYLKKQQQQQQRQ